VEQEHGIQKKHMDHTQLLELNAKVSHKGRVIVLLNQEMVVMMLGLMTAIPTETSLLKLILVVQEPGILKKHMDHTQLLVSNAKVSHKENLLVWLNQEMVAMMPGLILAMPIEM